VGRGMGSGRVVGEAGAASSRRALPNDGKREWRPHCDSAVRRVMVLKNEVAFKCMVNIKKNWPAAGGPCRTTRALAG